jgi:hypothetical protein
MLWVSLAALFAVSVNALTLTVNGDINEYGEIAYGKKYSAIIDPEDQTFDYLTLTANGRVIDTVLAKNATLLGISTADNFDAKGEIKVLVTGRTSDYALKESRLVTLKLLTGTQPEGQFIDPIYGLAPAPIAQINIFNVWEPADFNGKRLNALTRKKPKKE